MDELAQGRLERLFDLHLDGALSAEDERALEAILREPEARRRWRSLTVLMGGLLTELRGCAVDARSDRRASRWWLAGAAVAVIGVGLGVWGIKVVPTDGTRASGAARKKTVLTRIGHEPAPAEVAPRTPPPHSLEPDLVPSTAEVIWRFDADGERPATLTGGRIARCPPGAGVRTCVAAARFSQRWRDANGMQLIDRRSGLFDYDADLVLTFDYWLGESTSRDSPALTSYFHFKDRPPNVGYQHPGPGAIERGRWMRVAFPLAAYRPNQGAPPAAPGSRVDAFDIKGHYLNEDVIFFANVKVVRVSGLAPVQP